jgi:hypothetical protein
VLSSRRGAQLDAAVVLAQGSLLVTFPPMQRRFAVPSARRAALACVIVLTFLSIGLPVRAARAADAGAKQAADDWYEGTPPDGSFHVRGPARFEPYGVRDATKDTKVRTQGVRATQAGAFDAVTKYIASCVVDPDDKRKGIVRVEESVMLWQKQNVDFTYRRPFKVANVSGVEFQMSDPNKTLRVRVFPGPDRVCTVLVQWNPYAKPSDADIDRFLGSFAFVKR